jgi:catechol 2,3-dioxygenase-like lactoylglutathione lyase family enzyme
VSDIKTSAAFYESVLGLPHLYTFGQLAFFDCGGTRLMLTQKEVIGPESVLYFRVGHIGLAHQRLSERGVSFVGAPHLIHRHGDGTEEWMAFFKDPDGQLLAIMSQVTP